MPRIVQFLHTAIEATTEELHDMLIPWNLTKEHRRKFMVSNGRYADGENEETADLTFWGEWEAQSTVVERFEEYRIKLPTLLNKPFLNPGVAQRSTNTDPYVFGPNFRYVFCKQSSSELLRNLEPGSLILFGSAINKKFSLDTLFVVSEDIQKYSRENFREVFSQKNQFYYATVNPLMDDIKEKKGEDNCQLDMETEYSFYKGVNFKQKDDYDGMYSYVPCKKYSTYNKLDFLFKQPPLNLDILAPSQTQGLNTSKGREFTKEEVKSYWEEITKQVEAFELLKGTYFKNPPLS